jgi:hypothetical protein
MIDLTNEGPSGQNNSVKHQIAKFEVQKRKESIPDLEGNVKKRYLRCNQKGISLSRYDKKK